jgi:hypothetical protein
MKRIIFIAMVCTLALGFLASILSISSSEIDKNSDQVQEAYRAYVICKGMETQRHSGPAECNLGRLHGRKFPRKSKRQGK